MANEKLRGIASAIGKTTKKAVDAAKTTAVVVADGVKGGSEQLGQQLDQMKFDNDKKRLAPVFADELTDTDFCLPPILRIVSYDKRMDNKACSGAVGFMTGKDIKMLNIYREYLDLLTASFYPFPEDGVYYVDPCHTDLYIKLDEYFAYLKKMRVDELTAVAQCLGAKHVEIILKSHATSSNSQNSSASAGARSLGAEVSSRKSKSEQTGVEVAAVIDFSGNEVPSEPELVYFREESDIKALIRMRMDPNNQNRILSKTYSLKYGNSSGISISDAQKIDAALAVTHVSAGHSVTSEAVSENNTVLEYTIIF